jgi:hypothetical protein
MLHPSLASLEGFNIKWQQIFITCHKIASKLKAKSKSCDEIVSKSKIKNPPNFGKKILKKKIIL